MDAKRSGGLDGQAPGAPLTKTLCKKMNMTHTQSIDNRIQEILEDPQVKTLVAEVEEKFDGNKLIIVKEDSSDSHGGFDWQAQKPTIYLNPKSGINKSNICHELIHALQLKIGFPFIKRNIYPDKRERVIGELNSNILHIHLVSIFKKLGISTKGYLDPTIFQIKKVLTKRKKNEINSLPIFRIHFDSLVCLRIFYEAVFLNTKGKNHLLELFKKYSPISYNLSLEMKNIIDKENVLQPAGSTRAILKCLNLLNQQNASSKQRDFMEDFYIESVKELNGAYAHHL